MQRLNNIYLMYRETQVKNFKSRERNEGFNLNDTKKIKELKIKSITQPCFSASSCYLMKIPMFA